MTPIQKRYTMKQFKKQIQAKGVRQVKRYNLVYEFTHCTKMGSSVYRFWLFYLDREYRLIDVTYMMKEVIGVTYTKDGIGKVYDEFIPRLQLVFPQLKMTRL